MKKSVLKAVIVALLTLPATMLARETAAHNVWCHCATTDPKVTLRFFHSAGAVYEALSNVMATWHLANSPLESGVIAEFESILNGTALDPDKFRETLKALELLTLKLKDLDGKLRDLEKIAKDSNIIPVFDQTVTRILLQKQGIPRLSMTGVRYSDVGGIARKKDKIVGIKGIIDVQINDLQILMKVLDEVVVSLRDALPLAEKGEFAAVMLSGRNGFGDKMPQLTDMIYSYQNLYVKTCMSTIQATMQVYPKGFEWLKK